VSLLAACDPASSDPAAPPAVSVTPSAPDPQAATERNDPPLASSAADKVLVPPTSGSGKATTPWFAVPEKKYTIRIACIGGGELILFPGDEMLDVPCDGVSRRVHVATDEKRTRVPIAGSQSQRWTVSVVISDDFATVSPTPTVATA
jgi:hypothetical protein